MATRENRRGAYRNKPDSPQGSHPSVADALRQARVALGYTQAEVADAVGASQSVVSRWENGSASPEVTDLDALAVTYQTTSATLLASVDEKSLRAAVPDRVKRKARELASEINSRHFGGDKEE